MTRAELQSYRSEAAEGAARAPLGQLTSGSEVPQRPALAPNVQLVGEMQGMGFKDRQWLIQRGGQFIQLTELLYRLAEQTNGERTLEEIAKGVTESTDWIVDSTDVRQLIQTKLMPSGLIATGDGSVAPRGGAA